MSEDTKQLIRIWNSKTDDQMEKDNKSNNGLQNTMLKSKNWAARTPLKHGGERCPGKVDSLCSTCDPGHITFAKYSVISHE
jgi:hypothetical protein